MIIYPEWSLQLGKFTNGGCSIAMFDSPSLFLKVLRKLRCHQRKLPWDDHREITPAAGCPSPSRDDLRQVRSTKFMEAVGPLGFCENGPQNFMVDHHLVAGLEHESYEFPYIGNNHPNWLSNCSVGLKPPTRSCSLVKDRTGVHTLFSDCPNLRFWRQPSAVFARGALLTFLALFEMGAGSYNDLVLLERTNVSPINKGYYFEWF